MVLFFSIALLQDSFGFGSVPQIKKRKKANRETFLVWELKVKSWSRSDSKGSRMVQEATVIPSRVTACLVAENLSFLFFFFVLEKHNGLSFL